MMKIMGLEIGMDDFGQRVQSTSNVVFTATTKRLHVAYNSSLNNKIAFQN